MCPEKSVKATLLILLLHCEVLDRIVGILVREEGIWSVVFEVLLKLIS
jgi:hypothetical protein